MICAMFEPIFIESRIHSKKEKMPPFFETVSDSKQASKLTKIAEQYVTFNGM